jgi:carbon monoxide dehydrogenase subunit G
MEIEKSFELAYAPERVWDAFADVYLVAECLPGAAILARLDEHHYKGRFSVKLGPLAAAFDGEVTIERRPDDRSGTVAGKGVDSRSSSRASGTMRYRVVAAETPGRSRVDVVCELTLAGALAQFGKAAVIREVANRITAEFVKNFDARLAASAPQPAAAPSPAAPDTAAIRQAPPPLDAGSLAWSILRDRIIAFFRALFGRKAR